MKLVGKRRNLAISSIILGALAIISCFSLVLISINYFPDNHGYTRNIVYIRPTEGTNNPGYFVIIDEFNPRDDIEFIYHSYGDLTVNSSTGTVIFNQSGIEMKMKFIGSTVSIENATGMVYQTYPSSPSNDLVEYIKVKPLEDGVARILTIISFKNETINHPTISIKEKSSSIQVTVNNSDVFLVNQNNDVASGTRDELLESNAAFSAYRLNQTNMVDWIFFMKGSSLNFNQTTILNSQERYTGFFNASIGNIKYAGDGNGWEVQNVVSDKFNDDLLDSLVHPYLLFDDSILNELKNKCNGSLPGPWQTWYNNLGNSNVIERAFKGRIEENLLFIQQAEQDLLEINNIGFDWDDAQFISRSTKLYPYLFAYDMIYNNVSEGNRSAIEANLKDKIYPLADAIATGSQPTNNHIVVASTALGIGGLLFKNGTWVQLAQDQNDFYLENRIKGGPCYEGDIYGRYTFENAVKFFIALKRIGGYNYFSNPRFLQYLNYTVASVSPLGWTPLYEDCTGKSHLGNLASICSYQVNESNAILASNLRWYFEFCYGNENLGADIYRITAYDDEITPNAPNFGDNEGFAYFEAGLACFRTGWEKKDTYLVVSNKKYYQSHVHLDENSIEIYALGKKFLTNPGYPHWREEGHDYTISTLASNTALINGQGQLDIISDGFSGSLQNEVIDFINSPSLRAYKSPFSLNTNQSMLFLLVTSVSSLGAACIISLGFLFKARALQNHKTQKPVKKQHAPNSPTLSMPFKFNDEELLVYNFKSVKLSFFNTQFLSAIQSIGIMYFLIRVLQYITFQIKYIEISNEIQETILSIAPTVELLIYTTTPFLLFIFNIILFGLIAIFFNMSAKTIRIENFKPNESFGLITKVMIPQSIMFSFSIILTIFYITPEFLDAINSAQVDAGNPIIIGVFLKNLLASYLIPLIILILISMAIFFYIKKVLTRWAKKNGTGETDVQVAFFNSILIGLAIVSIIIFLFLIPIFDFFSVFELESNPLL